MKITLSIFDHRIAPVFDVASQALLVDIQANGVCEESLVAMPKEPSEAKVSKLVELGVKTLICGAISKPMLMLAQSQGIRVHDFIAGEIQEVLLAFRNKCLHEDEYRMPGCGRRQRCRHGRNRQGRGCLNKTRPGWAG